MTGKARGGRLEERERCRPGSAAGEVLSAPALLRGPHSHPSAGCSLIQRMLRVAAEFGDPWDEEKQAESAEKLICRHEIAGGWGE